MFPFFVPKRFLVLKILLRKLLTLFYLSNSPYSCNGRKQRCKHVSDSVPSSFDTREHFDYNIAGLTGNLINCSVSSSCTDRSNH